MIERCHLLKIGGAAMVYHFAASDVRARRLRGGANPFFTTEQGNTREVLSGTDGGSGDCARVFAFGQNYALRAGSGARS
jgi:hypothetical protein